MRSEWRAKVLLGLGRCYGLAQAPTWYFPLASLLKGRAQECGYEGECSAEREGKDIHGHTCGLCIARHMHERGWNSV